MTCCDGEELTLPEAVSPGTNEPPPGIALTVLFHPDIRRIGERALLPRLATGVDAELGRQQPLFSAVRAPTRALALDDPYLSRTPILISSDGVGLVLSVPAAGSSLMLNGGAVQERATVDARALQDGVILTLSHRVVLLLHRHFPPHCAGQGLPEHCGLVGESDSLQQARFLAQRVAGSSAPVLLLGESGTGKELLAAAIHRYSERAAAPLVAVNMGAIPRELAAAELFGVRRGAFTGADIDRAGYFQRAAAGTLFLDEIGACGSEVQAQLLRAIQQGEIQSPGGEVQRVDVRVLAATDADIDNNKNFSKALRHRLGGFEIQIAPLRERREDLGRLLVHFLPGGLLPGLAASAADVARWVLLVQQLALYAWPGNVRELSNFCQQIAIASEPGAAPTIPSSVSKALSADRDQYQVAEKSRLRPVAELSERRIREAMLAARWEISRAARSLGVSRQSLYKRIDSIPDLRIVADIPGAEIETVYQQCDGQLEEAALRMQVSRAALRRRWRAMDLLPRAY